MYYIYFRGKKSDGSRYSHDNMNTTVTRIKFTVFMTCIPVFREEPNKLNKK